LSPFIPVKRKEKNPEWTEEVGLLYKPTKASDKPAASSGPGIALQCGLKVGQRAQAFIYMHWLGNGCRLPPEGGEILV
jgi:hypothetical protein